MAGRGSVLIVAAGMIAALAATIVNFQLAAVLAIAVLCLVLLVAFPGDGRDGWPAAVAAALTVVMLVGRPPFWGVAPTGWLVPAAAAGLAAALFVAASPWLPRSPGTAAAGLALIGVSYILVILGGRPLIDVWILLRDAGEALLHGVNPYELSFPDVPAGQDDSCFTYVPGAFLLTAPSQWLFGDVRWLEGAYLLGSAGLLAWRALRPGAAAGALALALLVGVLPGSLMIVQRSWTEPMLLAGLTLAAVLIDRGRHSLAVLPLGLALATKQYLVLALPILLFWPQFGWRRVVAAGVLAGAICLPWFLWNPARFLACTVDFHIFLPTPAHSVSLWQLLPSPAGTIAAVLALALAYWVIWARAPRNGSGFLLGAGLVLALFNLFNKATFLNQWWLSAELIVAGLAIAAVTGEDSGRKTAGGPA